MIIEEYNEWLYTLAIKNDNDRCNYSKLLSKLNNTSFKPVHTMDNNRYDDGIDLRYRFGWEEGYDEIEIVNYIDCRECSVLEMMVALSLRIEENITYNIDKGRNCSRWFMEMLNSLQLYHMINRNYNTIYIEDRISKFLNRNYAKNGEGSLFVIHNPHYDMREIEIWQQAMLYLTENYSE